MPMSCWQVLLHDSAASSSSGAAVVAALEFSATCSDPTHATCRDCRQIFFKHCKIFLQFTIFYSHLAGIVIEDIDDGGDCLDDDSGADDEDTGPVVPEDA